MSEDDFRKSKPKKTDTSEPDPALPMHEGIPVFPFVPDAIKESRFFVIEAGDLKTEAEVANLIQQMWRQPEADFYYFFGHAGGRRKVTEASASNQGWWWTWPEAATRLALKLRRQAWFPNQYSIACSSSSDYPLRNLPTSLP